MSRQKVVDLQDSVRIKFFLERKEFLSLKLSENCHNTEYTEKEELSMMKLKVADSREQRLFQQKYCQNEEARLQIIKHFRVEADAYVELPVGCCVYNAIDGGSPAKGKIIVLQVMELRRRLCYFPVFSEATGRKLLHAWSMKMPPKMTAFACAKEQSLYGSLSVSNSSLRTLLEYFRWFTFAANHVYHPLPYGLRTIYNHLCKFPEEDVGVEVIKFVNDALAEEFANDNINRYTSCQQLQDYIVYLQNKYTLLQFKDADFSILRKLLADAFPEEKFYF